MLELGLSEPLAFRAGGSSPVLEECLGFAELPLPELLELGLLEPTFFCSGCFPVPELAILLIESSLELLGLPRLPE